MPNGLDLANPIPIVLAGVGKIARDQHIPAIAADPRFTLAATVSRHSSVDGVPAFTSLAEAKAAVPELRAISVCTPPSGRLALVREAIDAGLAIMLEKPPAGSVSEAEAIVATAAQADTLLFLTWHSREAAAVEPARTWLQGRVIRRAKITWKEDVRIWHPGQEWIWDPGIGVFDPGINALSVITRLLPSSMLVKAAALSFPANRNAPIAADLAFATESGVSVTAEFDFDQRGPQTWEIAIETDGGSLRLVDGAGRWFVDGEEQPTEDRGEYPRLYDRFAALLASGTSDTDLTPFRLVADCFQLGTRRTLADFAWS